MLLCSVSSETADRVFFSNIVGWQGSRHKLKNCHGGHMVSTPKRSFGDYVALAITVLVGVLILGLGIVPGVGLWTLSQAKAPLSILAPLAFVGLILFFVVVLLLKGWVNYALKMWRNPAAWEH